MKEDIVKMCSGESLCHTAHHDSHTGLKMNPPPPLQQENPESHMAL
jgi:hypothetical protein